MKIALVHDYIKEYGGAERVLETLHETYPDAPVYTLVYCPDFLGPHKERFKDWDIRTSFLQNLPFKEKFISIYRILAPYIFKNFDFSGYDVVVISSTGAYIPNMVAGSKYFGKKPKYITYCHTPPRYLYGYATAREWKKNPIIRAIAEVMNHLLRMVDFKAAQNIDQFIANSYEVKSRIKKFYRKDAIIIYPPIDVHAKFEIPHGEFKSKTYYLAGGRLTRAKHYDLIIKAANELKLPLKIFGKGFAGYGDELKEMAGPTVEFLGEVNDTQKLALMKDAKAFFMASVDEDFGIVPVEAMGQGTPVIAYFSGGVKETVIEGKTGVFFDELSVESIKKAVKRFEGLKIKSIDCIKRAEKFDKRNFTEGIKKVVEKAK
ncbi:MAG TPA: glycosyltransferase [Patescibacteria group bacterium]